MLAWFMLFYLIPIIWGQEKGQLVTVIVVYRHGDRTPVDPYPTDPYRNMSYWPVDFGQLTNLGKQQHYALGQWLRQRYDGFLPAKYNEKDIFVRSTDVDRTLMSSYANLAGLYEPAGKQVWNPDIKWQPIPVHTKPELEDYLLAMKKPCAKFSYLQNELLKSPKFRDIIHQNHDMFAYISLQSGRSIINIQTLEFMYNTLFIEALNNLTLPDWTKTVYPDKMRPIADLSFAIPCYTEELARLKTGPLFNEFLDNLFNVSSTAGNHSSSRKMWMYSAHDTTIANILNALKIFDYHSPPYASTILFELRYYEKAYYLKIFYKNATEARLMKLPDCDVDCPLEQFVKILDPINLDPKHWHDECEVSVFSVGEFSLLEDVIIIACSAMFLMLIASIVVGIMCTRPKGEQRSYLRLPDDDESA